jgi:hypothetical protein
VNRHALIIMAKAPEADNVKTRLKGSLSDQERLELYEGLLKGTIDKLRDLPGIDTFITFSPSSSKDYFNAFGLQLFAQEGQGLGERMHYAISHIIDKGYARVALVGVDIPKLSHKEIFESMELLEFADVVFGPARDGGYYLVGMNAPHPEVFKDIPWSTPDTLLKSLDQTAGAGLLCAMGPVLSDLDTPEDLKREGLV